MLKLKKRPNMEGFTCISCSRNLIYLFFQKNIQVLHLSALNKCFFRLNCNFLILVRLMSLLYFCILRTTTVVEPETSCQLVSNQTFEVQMSTKDSVISFFPPRLHVCFLRFPAREAALKHLTVMCPRGSGGMLSPCA